MLNESLFLLQTLIIIGFALGALKLGKEALITWVAFQAFIANLFVLKQITLFGLVVTASDAFAIGSLLGLNLLQEYFDKNDAKKATWICFFFMIFFTATSQIHLLYEPSTFDTTQNAYHTLLSPSPRLLFASMTVFFVVQQFDIRFFAYIKKLIPHYPFAARAAIALVVSQFLDTVLFSLLGLYGIVESVIDIILISFFIKLLVISFFSTFIRWIKYDPISF